MNYAQAGMINTTTAPGRVYLTHNFTCGACSTLHGLSIYLDRPDLETPVSKCAIEHLFSLSQATECLEKEVGFED